MSKLIEWAAQLLKEETVTKVIGYEKGNHGARPFFCVKPEEAEKLILDERCTNNIAAYLTKSELIGTGKVAVTAPLPVLRTIVQLVAENQLKDENLVVVTVNAGGELHPFQNLAEIKAFLADFPLGISVQNQQLLDKLKVMNREERWTYWVNEMSKCIKCYACRAACPLCYCSRCITEVNCPQWIQPWASPLSSMEWQINRVMHMAGRCVACGACREACPVGIPIHLLTLSMMEDIQTEFGDVPEKGNVLSTFCVEDKENFIR